MAVYERALNHYFLHFETLTATVEQLDGRFSETFYRTKVFSGAKTVHVSPCDFILHYS